LVAVVKGLGVKTLKPGPGGNETILLMSEQYRGMWIDPRVFEIADGSGWSAEVYVAEDDGPDTIDHRFILKPTFETEGLAVQTATATGRKIVDDKIRGLDIDSVIEQATRLPSTHRSAYGGRSDDVAAGTDGQAKKVPTSGNPNDRYD
jgi:hypothetical protein